MTPDSARAVQASWATLAPGAPVVAALFYDRLFALDPSLRSLFARTDMTALGRKFTDTLGSLVAALDYPDTCAPALRALGRRHADYGVQDTHYAVVGRALLDALTAGLGPAFTPEVRAAWREAYDAIAGLMRAAAAEQAAEQVAGRPGRDPTKVGATSGR